MSMKTKYILMIVTWLVVAGLIIRNRFIFKQPIATIATDATKADIVNAIYSIQSDLQNTIYATVWIGVCAIIAVLVLLYYAK